MDTKKCFTLNTVIWLVLNLKDVSKSTPLPSHLGTKSMKNLEKIFLTYYFLGTILSLLFFSRSDYFFILIT